MADVACEMMFNGGPRGYGVGAGSPIFTAGLRQLLQRASGSAAYSRTRACNMAAHVAKNKNKKRSYKGHSPNEEKSSEKTNDKKTKNGIILLLLD